MIIRTVKVSDKGQIAIPLEIREAGNIKKGDVLVIVESSGKLLLQKAKDTAQIIKDEFKDLI